MKKRLLRTKFLSLAIAAFAVTGVFATASFLSASASDDVSPTDTEMQQLLSSEESAPVANDEVGQPESTEPELTSPKEPERNSEGCTVQSERIDLILSSQTGLKRKNGTNYKKFLSGVSYNGSYKSELKQSELQVYDGLYNTYVINKKSDKETVKITFSPDIPFTVTYSVPAEDKLDFKDLGEVDDIVLSAAAAFFYDCPEAYWIRGFNYTIHSDLETSAGVLAETGEKAYVDWIEITFPVSSYVANATDNAYPGAYDDLTAFTTGIATAKASIEASRLDSSPYETVKAIHDYILLHAAYNYNALNGDTYTYGYAFSAAPLFVPRLNGLFVCEGYSKAMKILCNEFNINCALVSGTGKTSDTSGGPHMWCYVQLDGNWYAVDATWDDGHYYSDGTPCPVYSYFLVGSGTWVTNTKKFSQNHITDGAVMYNWDGELVFPTLSKAIYDHYIVDTNPTIHLHTLGAGIRLSEPYGIRFGIQLLQGGTNIPDGTVVPEFGTLIIPTSILGDNELTISTPTVRKIRAENIYSQDETQLTFTGVLINIPQSSFDTNMTGRGYLIYIDKNTGKEHIVYSDPVERSFNWVANAALEQYESIQNPTDTQKAMIQKLKKILNKQ